MTQPQHSSNPAPCAGDAFVPVPCACGHQSTTPLLTIDRYLLPLHIAVCEQCGLTHSSRNLPASALPQFYREEYRRFYEEVRTVTPDYLAYHKPALNAAYRMAVLRPLMPTIRSVLEIGCGLGFFLDACRTQGVHEVMGLEPGETFRHYAQETLGLGAAVREEDYTTFATLPFTPQLVVLFHVFEHLADPAGCLAWIARHIAADGVLVIEVPDIDADWRGLGLQQFHVAHRWYFSEVTLCNLLARHGFTPIFIMREAADGIYPGNLRVMARLGVPGAPYPLPVPPAAHEAKRIRRMVSLASPRHGVPRSLLRRIRRYWRNR